MKAGLIDGHGILVNQTAHNDSRLMRSSHSEPAVVNPKTGKAERVFVNLEAVYPDESRPDLEYCFEELRAMSRGWANRDWRPKPASPLRTISSNIQPSPSVRASQSKEQDVESVTEQVREKLVLTDENSSVLPDSSSQQIDVKETKPPKQRRIKVREIKQEAQTGKTAS